MLKVSVSAEVSVIFGIGVGQSFGIATSLILTMKCINYKDSNMKMKLNFNRINKPMLQLMVIIRYNLQVVNIGFPSQKGYPF